MYGPETTARQLALALPAVQTQWQRLSNSRTFEFRYHTLSEVETMSAHFNSLIDSQGNLTRKLTLDEHRWMINERALCRWDFNYYITRYYRILHWDGTQIVPLNPNIPQRIAIDLWAEREAQNLSIAQLYLKARQEGVTTLWQAAVAHRVQFFPNVRAVVGSSRPDKSREMIGKALTAWNLMSWYIRSPATTYRAGELILFDRMKSSINIQHGAKVKSGMARGETPSVVHLSECAEYLNPEEDIDSAIVFAMHRSPNMLLGLESTAKGQLNWWHKNWLDAKANWNNPTNPSLFQPVLLPWYIASDIYPTETWLRETPIPQNWKPSALTERHARKASAYVRATPLLSKHLSSTWNMPPAQQWFWEATRAQYERRGQLNSFYQEMPADDIEAFQHDGASIFSAEQIMVYNDSAQHPKMVYGLEGPTDEVRIDLQPDRREVNPNYRPLVITSQRETGGKSEYRLLPLRLDGYPNQFSPIGKILVWEPPMDGVDYGLGIDTAQGIGQDRSVIEVLRKATIAAVARQCAEFASEWVSASDLFPYAHCLAKLYQRKDPAGQIKQPYITIETNNGGDAVQLALRKAGWGRLHPWMRYDKKLIDASKAQFVGAVTTSWSRDLVLGHLIKALRDGLLDIDSPWFIQEMQTLQKEEGKARIAAILGAHDDRFFALGWIYMTMHILEFGEIKSVFGKGRILNDDEAPAPPAPVRPPTPMEQPIPAEAVDRFHLAQHRFYDPRLGGMDSPPPLAPTGGFRR